MSVVHGYQLGASKRGTAAPFARFEPSAIAAAPIRSRTATAPRVIAIKGCEIPALARRVKSAARVARLTYAPRVAALSGLADLSALSGDDLANSGQLTAADVSWAMSTDVEGLAALARSLADHADDLDENGRKMIVAIGEGVADPWMLGLAGLDGHALGLGFFKKLAKFGKKVVQVVGKVAGVVAPIAAVIPGGQAIAAGAAAVASATGGGGSQGGSVAVGTPGIISQPNVATAASNAIEAAKADPAAPPWWSKLLELAITAGKTSNSAALAPADDAPQGTPAIASKGGSVTLSTPFALALAAGALLILSRK
jgi:hypothetical protein